MGCGHKRGFWKITALSVEIDNLQGRTHRAWPGRVQGVNEGPAVQGRNRQDSNLQTAPARDSTPQARAARAEGLGADNRQIRWRL